MMIVVLLLEAKGKEGKQHFSTFEVIFGKLLKAFSFFIFKEQKPNVAEDAMLLVTLLR